MIDWLTAALIAISIGIGVALFDKYALSRTSAASYLFLIGCVNIFSLLFIPLGFAHMPTPAQWAYGIGLGIVFSISIYATFRAFQKEEVSRLVPLGILSTLLIAAGSAVFFDEQLTKQQLWAFLLFLVGAALLATRIVIKVELLDDITNFRLERVGRKVQRAAEEAWHHPVHVGKSTSNQLFWTMYDIFDAQWVSPVVDYMQYRRRLKLIKGLGWYLLAIGITVPYILLARQLNTTVGVTTGFMTIRVGLFIGSLFFLIGHWHEFAHFLQRRRLLAASGVKEIISAASGVIWWVAATSGPLSIVQALGSLQSAGVFVLGSLLAYFGIIHESLKRRDLVQKGLGVLCIAVATVLLFI